MASASSPGRKSIHWTILAASSRAEVRGASQNGSGGGGGGGVGCLGGDGTSTTIVLSVGTTTTELVTSVMFLLFISFINQSLLTLRVEIFILVWSYLFEEYC